MRAAHPVLFNLHLIKLTYSPRELGRPKDLQSRSIRDEERTVNFTTHETRNAISKCEQMPVARAVYGSLNYIFMRRAAHH